jgi:hypothetical protein
MGSGRRRVMRADLEAMLGEFELVERYGGTSAAVEMHLDQLRRNAMLGGAWGTGHEIKACRWLTPGRSSDF